MTTATAIVGTRRGEQLPKCLLVHRLFFLLPSSLEVEMETHPCWVPEFCSSKWDSKFSAISKSETLETI